jgi:hypothetical protein
LHRATASSVCPPVALGAARLAPSWGGEFAALCSGMVSWGVARRSGSTEPGATAGVGARDGPAAADADRGGAEAGVAACASAPSGTKPTSKTATQFNEATSTATPIDEVDDHPADARAPARSLAAAGDAGAVTCDEKGHRHAVTVARLRLHPQRRAPTPMG